jgi:poly(3-hydroxybutyrate) depolymerase
VGPTSPLLVIALLGIAIGMLVLLVRLSHLALKLVAGAVALTISIVTGLVLVNDYYGYYRTWGDAYRDVRGTATTEVLPGVSRTSPAFLQYGTVEQISLAGKSSGIKRDGLVYLPPQYFDPRFKKVKFPVIEMFHGSPGKPENWLNSLHVTHIVDELLASHQMGPAVLVMPAINQGNAVQECLNSPRGQDDTYLTTDVPADIRSQYRVSADPAQWGLLGFSSGGYCAANLGLRHPSSYGTVAALDGYYRPADGPAGGVLKDSPLLISANDPYSAALALPGDVRPLPSFWVMAGTGGPDAIHAKDFVAALSHVEQVPLVLTRSAGHDFYAWSAALLPALKWSWLLLAPPDLRVLFPIAGPSAVQTLPLLKGPRQVRPKTGPPVISESPGVPPPGARVTTPVVSASPAVRPSPTRH